MAKPIMYTSDNVLEEFYKAIADEDSGRLRRVHIPRSDVFYVREAIYNDTGVKYSLDRVERAMLVEGFLKPQDCFEPQRIRKFDDGNEY
jgi:hypothetical protein